MRREHASQAEEDAMPKPKAKAKAKRTKPVGVKDADSHIAAKKHLPPVPECTISLQTEWHTIWRIEYPKASPPYSHNVSFVEGSAASKRKALMQALEWAWAEHFEATGQPCPYDFSAE